MPETTPDAPVPLMPDAIELLTEEARKHARYVVDAKTDLDKAYWRTFVAGILHAVNALRGELETNNVG